MYFCNTNLHYLPLSVQEPLCLVAAANHPLEAPASARLPARPRQPSAPWPPLAVAGQHSAEGALPPHRSAVSEAAGASGRGLPVPRRRDNSSAPGGRKALRVIGSSA